MSFIHCSDVSLLNKFTRFRLMEKLLLKPKLLSRLFSKMPGYSNGKMFRCLAMLVIFALIGLLAGQLENHFSLVRKAWFALRSYSLVSFRFNTKSYEEYANFDGCLRNVTRVLIFVASAPVNFERRKALRLTWKNKNATKMTFTQPNSCKVKGNGHGLRKNFFPQNLKLKAGKKPVK